MKRNMKAWLNDMIASPTKKALPVLSFPAIQLMDITVRELISDADRQAEGMAKVAARVNASASVSLMDLSVEAECFGSTIRVSDEEVPTVTGSIVKTQEDVEILRCRRLARAARASTSRRWRRPSKRSRTGRCSRASSGRSR